MKTDKGRRLTAVMAIAACATALAVSGCTWRPKPPQTTTTTTTTATTTTTMAGHDHDGDGADDKGWSQLLLGHAHPQGEVPLDAATQAELDRQLAITRELVPKYPTVAAATAAGFVRGGPYAPGLGVHY